VAANNFGAVLAAVAADLRLSTAPYNPRCCEYVAYRSEVLGVTAMICAAVLAAVAADLLQHRNPPLNPLITATRSTQLCHKISPRHFHCRMSAPPPAAAAAAAPTIPSCCATATSF
jgi:hypothetical protein